MWQSGLQWSFNYIWLAKLQGIRLGAANFWNGVLHGHLFGFTGKFRIAINTSGQVLGVSILRCRVRRIAAYVLSMPDLLTGANGFAKKVWSRLARYFFSVLWVPTHAFGLQSGRRGLPSSYYTSGVPGYLQQTSVAVINPEMILSIYPILNRSWLWSWFARPFFLGSPNLPVKHPGKFQQQGIDMKRPAMKRPSSARKRPATLERREGFVGSL